jgi:putative aminopeptidase FrvX
MDLADQLFETIRELAMRHSPSGVEGAIDTLLIEKFAALGVAAELDAAGNVIAKIPGKGSSRLAITAHKDEIGASVSSVEDGGKLKLRPIGGSFPWVYGEGVVDILGDVQHISGVLSFGSRHVSHASPQHAHQDSAPVRWADVWVETKCTMEELAAAGVRPGTRVLVGAQRKHPFRMKNHIASYGLDNKASLAVLLELARRVKEPVADLYLVATSKEEVGAVGAMYFTHNVQIDALIALEIAPIAKEYSIRDRSEPVLLYQDGHGLYDDGLNARIRAAAQRCAIPLQLALVTGFGSDGSYAMRAGRVPRAACLGFPTENTHGYEIVDLAAIERCIDVLENVCAASL